MEKFLKFFIFKNLSTRGPEAHQREETDEAEQHHDTHASDLQEVEPVHLVVQHSDLLIVGVDLGKVVTGQHHDQNYQDCDGKCESDKLGDLIRIHFLIKSIKKIFFLFFQS